MTLKIGRPRHGAKTQIGLCLSKVTGEWNLVGATVLGKYDKKNGQELLDALEEEVGLIDGWENEIEWESVAYDEDETILVREVHLSAKGCKDLWKIIIDINYDSSSGSSFDDEKLEIAALYVFFKWKDKERTKHGRDFYFTLF